MPIRSQVRIKICGLTSVEQAEDCVRAGADWIGLNFHPASPRFVSLDKAHAIIKAIPRPARAVGLFVNRPSSEVVQTAQTLGLEIIQLHGDEPPDYLPALRDYFLIRAFRIGGVDDLDRLEAYLATARQAGRLPDAILVDANVAGMAGGTGTLVPEALLDRLPADERLILAGGLSPENVAARVARVRPWMVDVASGVESFPGRKDPELVQAFVTAVRSVSLDRQSSDSAIDFPQGRR